MSVNINKIKLAVENEICILSGELTRQTVPSLSSRKIKKILTADKTTFDFKAVSKVDTAGLAWVCVLLEQADKNNCQLSFMNLPEQLTKLAMLSGVNDFLPEHVM
jgi:phospholipid transport system transporter-binding protein